MHLRVPGVENVLQMIKYLNAVLNTCDTETHRFSAVSVYLEDQITPKKSQKKNPEK